MVEALQHEVGLRIRREVIGGTQQHYGRAGSTAEREKRAEVARIFRTFLVKRPDRVDGALPGSRC
jgi:hypothetical protein